MLTGLVLFLVSCTERILSLVPVSPLSLSICFWDPFLNQNRHLWPDTMGSIVPLWKESMCFANAALAAASLRDNFYIQPLIKEHSSAWMTSSKVPGGCGKRPVSKCGLNVGPVLTHWMDTHRLQWYRVQLSPAEVGAAHGGLHDQHWQKAGGTDVRFNCQTHLSTHKNASTHTHKETQLYLQTGWALYWALTFWPY